MANALQLRRGTTTQHSTFTGLAGEVTVDTTKDTVVVHDGATAGGIPLATEASVSASNLLTAIKTVDGAGSGLDADLLDGQTGTYYTNYADTAVANLVAAAPSTLDTLNELAAALGDDPNFATTVTNSIATKLATAGGTMTGSVTFNDNAMARFGAGNDLSIYHDGANSFITDSGTGSLKIVTNTLSVRNAADSLTQLSATEGGAVRLYYSGSEKLATNANGIGVTGKVEADDIHVSKTSGNAQIGVQADSGIGSIEVGGSTNAFIDIKVPYSDDFDTRYAYNSLNCTGDYILQRAGSTKLTINSTGADITGTLTTDGVTVDGQLDIEEVHEFVNTSSSTSGTITFTTTDQGILYQTANQTANRTINFTNVNTSLGTNQSVTCTVLLTQGTTPYYINAYQVDGTAVTPKWSGGSAPTGGNASGIDVYTFTIIKTANATFTVLASLTQFA